MHIAEVIGTLVASHADPGFEGLRLLLLQEVDARGNPNGGLLVGADAVGATDGDKVLVSIGTAAQRPAALSGRPVDCAVVAIIDRILPASPASKGH